MARELLIGIAGGAIVTLIYGLLVAQREHVIRGYLSARRAAWVRKRAVRAFVQAVRGEAPVAEARLLVTATIILAIAFGESIWLATSQMQDEWNRVTATAERTRLPSTNEELEKQRAALEKELDEKIKNAARTVPTVIFGLRTAAVVWSVAWTIGGFFWLSFVVLRRRLTSEVSRFALRIQGLATKAELAELALAESRVRDEATLRAFIELARAVAARHNVTALVDRFDLWDVNREETVTTS